MLKFLKIQNFAIIKESEIDFSNGLNVLSGETGAGKSIILKAIKFVLGSRAEKSNIRNGENFAKVQATFFDCDCSIKPMLDNFDIEYTDELIISRTYYIDGKNDIKINGNSVTLSFLSKLCENIVDIYNQEDHYSLLNVKEHINILDKFDKENIFPLKITLANIIDEISNINLSLSNNFASEEEKARELDMLKFQIEEIENNIFTDNELNELTQKKILIQNITKISNALQNCDKIFNEGFNGYSLSGAIKEIQNSLKPIIDFDAKYAELFDRLDNIKYELEDISNTIYDNLESVDISDEEIDNVENRIEIIKNLQKKYGNSLDLIKQNLLEFKNKFDFITNNDEIVKELKLKKNKLYLQAQEIATKISTTRKNIAHKLETNVIKELADLGMINSTFKIDFKNVEETYLTKNGKDDIEFLFSANKGQPVRPLSKIISGGELSRFMLAYKNVAYKNDKKDILIFDEIDAGISGEIGQKLAEKLYNIGSSCQVISISHLAQIVAMASSNFLVEKIIDNENTISIIKNLSAPEKEQEVARICGIGKTSQTGLKLAKELIEIANNFKNQ